MQLIPTDLVGCGKKDTNWVGEGILEKQHSLSLSVSKRNAYSQEHNQLSFPTMQGVDGQEPAHNSDLVDGMETPKASPAAGKKKSSPETAKKNSTPRVKSTEKVIPLANCFHCKKQVAIVKPRLVKTPAGNNKKEGLRFAGHCPDCDMKVGIFVDSNLEVHPKPKKDLTPEQKLKKKERSKKKRAKKAELRKAALRASLGLGPEDKLPSTRKRKASEDKNGSEEKLVEVTKKPDTPAPVVKKQRSSKKLKEELAKQ